MTTPTVRPDRKTRQQSLEERIEGVNTMLVENNLSHFRAVRIRDELVIVRQQPGRSG